jgi:hypothetical protein
MCVDVRLISYGLELIAVSEYPENRKRFGRLSRYLDAYRESLIVFETRECLLVEDKRCSKY